MSLGLDTISENRCNQFYAIVYYLFIGRIWLPKHVTGFNICLCTYQIGLIGKLVRNSYYEKVSAIVSRPIRNFEVYFKMNLPILSTYHGSFTIVTSMAWTYRLVIFPMFRNNSFETSDFADPRFSFWKQRWYFALSHRVLMEKFIVKQKQMISCFLSKEFFFFRLEKNQRANSWGKKFPRCINWFLKPFYLSDQSL